VKRSLKHLEKGSSSEAMTQSKDDEQMIVSKDLG